MKTIQLLLAFVGLAAIAGEAPAVHETATEIAAWEKPFFDVIEQQKTVPPEVAIRRLGDIVGKLANDNRPELKSSSAFQAARTKLLAIPGYANFFEKEIKRLTDEEFAGTLKESASDRGWNIHILEQLPGPGTVRVLGELLFDERNLEGNMPSDSPWTPNALKAAHAFHNLGLKNPPVGSKFGNARLDLPTWRLWYEQVRAGNRTFSFQGDNAVYTLNGPVRSAAATGDSSKSEASALPPDRISVKSSNLQYYIFIGLLAVLIITVLGWWRKSKSVY